MTRYQEARGIFDKSKSYGIGDGNKIVHVLLKDRDIDELNEEEFWLLTRGYNWAMKDLEALEASKVAVRKFPENVELLHSHWDYMYNCYCDDSPLLIEKAKENIKSHLGEPAFWYLCMAEEAIDLAYIEDKEEDYEWQLPFGTDHVFRISLVFKA